MNPIFGTESEKQQQLTMPPSVAEVEALIAKHPYCQNLYYQLLEANVIENGIPPGEAALARIATYATDRRFLFDHLNDLLYVEKEENKTFTPSLELTETPYEEKIHQSKEEEVIAEQMALDQIDSIGSNRPDSNLPYETDDVDQINELLEGATYFEDEEGPSSFVEYISPEKLIPEEDNHTGLSFLEKIIDATSGPPSFFEWDQTILAAQMTAQEAIKGLWTEVEHPIEKPVENQIHTTIDTPIINPIDTHNPSHTTPPSKRKKPFAKRIASAEPQNTSRPYDETIQTNEVDAGAVEEIAQKSVMENNEIASETLAELLVAQEQYEKALRMYERLILIIPEKSSFFAEKIQYLRKIIAR